MSKLEAPLSTLLRSDVDSSTAHRVWQGVGARRADRHRARHRFALVCAFAVGVVAAALSLTTIGRFGVDPLVASHDRGAGPLRVRVGEAWSSMEAPADGERVALLEDGSRVALDPGATLATLENTGRSVTLRLAAGRIVFDVHSGGPRRWTIEAGLATIEVVGTRFVVQRTKSEVTVEVERGAVLVRGERVPDRVQRVEAGHRISIEEEPPPEAPRPAPPIAVPAPRSERARAVRDDSWRDLATKGDYAAAYQALGTGGIATRTQTADLDQLLALADVARFSGHAGDAVEPLRRAVAEHAQDPRAALAAFTLGRVHLDSLGDPASAARDFRDALSLGLPHALVEDAYLRLMEAASKAGNRSAAHQAWEEFSERFPQSPRRAVADRWGREP